MSALAPDQATLETALLLKIQELRNMARTIMEDMDDIHAASVTEVKDGIDISKEVRRFEVNLIKRALLVSHGQQLRASRLLGLKPTTLNAKIKRYEIRV